MFGVWTIESIDTAICTHNIAFIENWIFCYANNRHYLLDENFKRFSLDTKLDNNNEPKIRIARMHEHAQTRTCKTSSYLTNNERTICNCVLNAWKGRQRGRKQVWNHHPIKISIASLIAAMFRWKRVRCAYKRTHTIHRRTCTYINI